MSFHTSLWIVSHLLIIYLYFNRGRYVLWPVFLLYSIYLYGSGQVTGDVANSYRFGMFNDPAQYDIGFFYLIKLFSTIGFSNYWTIVLIQLLLSVLLGVMYCLFVKRKDFLLIISVFLLTVHSFLAVQNGLRQGFASALIVIAYYCLNKKMIYSSLIFCVFSQLMHWSSLFFILVISVLVIFRSQIDFFIFRKQLRPGKSIGIKRFLRLLLITFMVTSFSLLLLNGYPDFFSRAARNNSRFVGLTKMFPILLIFFISTFYWLCSKLNDLSKNFLLLRSVMLAIFCSLTIIGMIEVASRVLFFYFLIEAILAVSFITGSQNQRIGSAIVLLSYSGAINVIELMGNFTDL